MGPRRYSLGHQLLLRHGPDRFWIINDNADFIHSSAPMIPRIIHQTWKTADIPEPREWPESWKRLNPAWDYRLWTDDDLLELVRTHYPALEELFSSYPNPVQRADMGRYLVLDHCGGIYADLDTECLSSLEVIAQETRVVLCEEPPEHNYHALPLGMNALLFNGVMASPKGHPFWAHLLNVMIRCRHATDYVLESTGPLALTGAVQSFAAPETVSISSCHLFNPITERGTASASPVFGEYGTCRISNHYWNGSWFSKGAKSRTQSLKRALRKAKYKLTRGPYLSRDDIAKQINKTRLHRPISPDDQNVTVLVPVRDAAPFLDRFFEQLVALDYPKDKLRVVFCEGDSVDGTATKLDALVLQNKDKFRDITVTHLATDNKIPREDRWFPALQLKRRAALARVRNHLVDVGLAETVDWALWIDVDICDFAPGILKRLLAERAKVVTPECVREWDGPSYDLNAFNDTSEQRDHKYYKHVLHGLYMPPKNHHPRKHMQVFRFVDRVPLTSVGGTMLLVHSSVYQGGIRFPEIPYDNLIETEGFGRICHDFGVQPIGLPNVQIRHVQS